MLRNMGVQAFAAIVSTVVAIPALITFVASFWTARGSNQRVLRERLRTQFREMELACLVHFEREGWQAVRRNPTFSLQALEQIHQDGLLSPSHSHVARVVEALRDIRDRTHVQIPQLPEGHDLPLRAENARRQEVAWELLDADVHKYLRALGKMDNAGLGGYWTYLRYRIFRARPYVNGPIALASSP